MFKFLLSSFFTLVALHASLGHPSDVSANIENLSNLNSPILPLIDDPLLIADGEFSLEPFAPSANGSVSLCSGVVTGLSALSTGVSTGVGGIGGITLTVKVGLPTVQIEGLYTSNIELAEGLIPISPGDLKLVGQGALLAGLKEGNVTVVARLRAKLTGKVEITALNIDIGFESASANLEDFMLNGLPIGWEALNPHLKTMFDNVWGAIKDNVTAAIKDVANEVIKDCTVGDFIGIIVGNSTAECLSLPENSRMPNPLSLLRAIIKPNVACQVLVPTTEEPDHSDEPVTEPEDEETSTSDDKEPPSTTLPPSSSVVIQPFYQIMYLFLLIAAVHNRLFPTC